MNLKLFLKKLKKNKQKYPIVKRNSSLFFKQLQKEKEIKKKVLKNYINNYFFNKKYFIIKNIKYTNKRIRKKFKLYNINNLLKKNIKKNIIIENPLTSNEFVCFKFSISVVNQKNVISLSEYFLWTAMRLLLNISIININISYCKF